MKYRYHGSGFVVNAKAGETLGDTMKRVVAEQPNVDRPSGSLLRSQVTMVHAIEDLRVAVDFEQAKQPLIDALSELAKQAYGLVPME